MFAPVASTSATSGASATGTAWSRPRPPSCPHGSPRSPARSATSRRRTSRSTTRSGRGRSGAAPSRRAAITSACSRAVKVPVLFTHHFRHGRRGDGRAHGRPLGPAGRARPRARHRGRAAVRVPVAPGDGPLDARPGPRSCFADTVTEWAGRSSDRRGWVSVVVTTSRPSEVGTLTVRRALPRRGRRTVGAWCFADHMGPVAVTEGQGVDIGPHPHTGLQTVTWLRRGRDRPPRQPRVRAADPARPAQPHDGRPRRVPRGGGERALPRRPPRHPALGGAARGHPSRRRAFEHHAELPTGRARGGAATVLVGTRRRAVAGPPRHRPRRRRADAAAGALDAAARTPTRSTPSWCCRARSRSTDRAIGPATWGTSARSATSARSTPRTTPPRS